MKLYLPFNGRVKVSSPFGNRTLNGAADYHKGLDLVALDDITVRAPCDGVIGSSLIITDRTNLTWQWGNYIRLDTADGLHIYMCHLASRAVEAGRRVKKGDVLGVMGNTGYSFGAHTHFEVRNGKNESINPCQFLGIENKQGNVYVNNNMAENKEESKTNSTTTGNNSTDIEDGEMIYNKLMAYLKSLPESQWSIEEGAFSKATKAKIIDGKSPRAFVTREQLAAVLERREK